MRFKGKILLGVILWSVMMLGMTLTVLAYDGNPYASLVNTTTSVKFNNIDWYIIKDESSAVNSGTVTLLAKKPIGESKFHDSRNFYSESTVKDYLDDLTAENGSFAGVADTIESVNLTTKWYNSEEVYDYVKGAKLWLLSTTEANGLSEAVRKCSWVSEAGENIWWLRSPGIFSNQAACVFGGSGDVDDDGFPVKCVLGVRPALKLNLSKVIFDSEKKEFSLAVSKVNLTSSTNNLTVDRDTATLTATVSPAGADQTVKWSVTEGSDKVKLYEDAECKTAITLDSPTDTLKVYAKGTAAGTAKIKVTSADNENITDECSVTVYPAHTHDNISFQPWDSADSLPDKPGDYYLTKDVELSNTWNVPANGPTCLCLNGHNITMTGQNSRVILIKENATLNLYDEENKGKITGSNNDTYAGGGVLISSGTFNMYGGWITGNRSGQNGGGVEDHDKFYMYGGKITGNYAGADGGGVFVAPGKTFSVSGDVEIAGNYKKSVGKEEDNNVYLRSDNTGSSNINIAGPLTGSGKIGVTNVTMDNTGSIIPNPDKFTTGWKNKMGENTDPANYFTSDNPGFIVEKTSEGEVILVHAHDGISFKSLNKGSMPSKSGDYFLAKDVKLGKTWTAPEGITNICLNGHSIKLISSTGSVIIVPSGAILNLYDCDETEHRYTVDDDGFAIVDDTATEDYKTFKGGYVTGGRGTNEVSGQNRGGGILITGGSVVMQGGTIIGNNAKFGGGVCVFSNGSFELNSGNIIGNECFSDGGGIFNESSSTTINGGRIYQNTAYYRGGGIGGSGDVLLTGGEITENTISKSNGEERAGAGIYVYPDTQFKVEGNPKVTGNSKNNVADNVCLCGDVKPLGNRQAIITVTGPLTPGASIGITMQTPDVFTSGWKEKMGEKANPADFFASDTADYHVEKTSDGEEVLLSHTHRFTYSATGGTITATCAGLKSCSLTDNKATLTIEKPARTTYGGTEDAEAKITDDDNIKGDAQIQYYKAKEDGSIDGSKLGAAPTSAGKYRAEITLGTGNNAATAYVVYSIAPKSVTATVTAQNREYQKGNTSVSLNPGAVNDVVSGDEVTVDVTEASGTMDDDNAGDNKTVTVTGVKLEGKDAGNYSLSGQPTGVTVTINKASGYSVTKNPDPNSFYYDGTEKELLSSAGESNGGTVVYAIGNANTAPDPDDENTPDVQKKWSISVPKGTDAGVYYIWCKAAGDANHNDSEAVKVVSKIVYSVTFKVDKGEWNTGGKEDVILPLSRYENEDLALTLTKDDFPAVGDKPDEGYKKGYDEGLWKEQTKEGLKDVTVPPDKAISSAKTYVYTYQEKEKAVVTKDPEATNPTYSGSDQKLVTAGTVTTGCSMQYALGTKTAPTTDWSPSIPEKTETGTYYVWYRAKGNEDYKDSEPKCIEASIKTRNVTVSVEDKEVEYNGSEQEGYKEYEFSGVADGHTATITYTPAKGKLVDTYDNGSFDNDFKVMAGDDDVTSNYNLTTKTKGKLIIKNRTTPYQITVVANSSTDNIYDGAQKSVTGFETLEFTVGGNKYTVEGLNTSNPSSKDVCDLKNGITGTAVVKDAGGNDVTGQFKVEKTDGKLKINKRSVTLTSESGEKTYDGTALTKPVVTVGGDKFVDGEVSDIKATGSVTNVGEVTNEITWTEKDGFKAGNYDIRKTEGKLKITARQATVTAKDQTINEGETIKTGIEFATLSGAVDGHSLSAVTLKEKDGKIEASEAGIKDSAGDVTGNYDITYHTGTLTVRKKISATVLFKVENGAWNDGKTEEKKVTLSGFEGDTLKLKDGDIPAVGAKPNENYKAGGWDKIPNNNTPITQSTTYIYTYAKKGTPQSAPKTNLTIALNSKLKSIWKSSKLSISYGKVPGATSYVIYASYCNGKGAYKNLGTSGKTTVTISKLYNKKLKKNEAVKFYVVAKNGKKKIAKSLLVHVAGPKSRYTNVKKIKLKKKKIKLAKGKTAKIKASLVKEDKKKKLLPKSHGARIRYATSDKSVATVNKKGRIKAKGKGRCDIYVYAVNGKSAKVRVTVR